MSIVSLPRIAGQDTGSDVTASKKVRHSTASSRHIGSESSFHGPWSPDKIGDADDPDYYQRGCGCSKNHDITDTKETESQVFQRRLSRKSIVRELTMPASHPATHAAMTKSHTDKGLCNSPIKSAVSRSTDPKRRQSAILPPEIRITSAWTAPHISDERYQGKNKR